MNAHETKPVPPAAYPYMWAMANAIFLLLAVGAVLDPEPQSLVPKLTGSLALLVAGAKQSPGVQAHRPMKERVFTVVFLVADVVLIALLWLVR